MVELMELTRKINNMGKIQHYSLLFLGILSFLSLLLILVGIWFFKQEVFIDQANLSGVEILMLIGFGLILIFNLLSFINRYIHLRKTNRNPIMDKAVLVLGILCIFLLWGDKVLVDEIAREIRLGWEVTGEWVILYLFLSIQLIYNFLILYNLIVHRPRKIDE